MFYRRIACAALLLGSTCTGQVKFDDSPRLIKGVLAKAHISASIVYSDDCKYIRSRLPVPPHVSAPRGSGSPLELLRQMLSGNSQMKVTQDPNGTIRIVQDNTPTDILNVKIHHIKFPPRTNSDPNEPDRALGIILSSPEVRSFEEEHLIPYTYVMLEGVHRSDLPVVSGELYDVTLSQALDYVLKTFPGYWLYASCTTEDGRRTVDFRFY